MGKIRTKFWWMTKGLPELTKALTEPIRIGRKEYRIKGSGIGYIPLSNLVERADEYDWAEVAKLVSNDGLTAKVDAEKGVMVYIK